MIVAITPNPSVDISYFVENFQIGEAHRTEKFNKVPGGKGINVAKVLDILGSKVLCTGFIGGNGGKFIKDSLKEMNISSEFLTIDGETRSSIAISDLINRTTTEIREPGPEVDSESLEKFFDLIEEKKKESDIFSCSGSLPKGLDETFFDKLIEALNDKKLVLDTSGNGLRHVVFNSKSKPLAIKPNIDEIRELYGDKINSLSYVEILNLDEMKQIPIVIISLGKEGCFARFYDRYFECKVPKIDAVNSVGSGDSSLAGLCYGIEKNLSPEDTLRYSMACGVLNTLEEKIGYINIDNLEKVKNEITVKEVFIG